MGTLFSQDTGCDNNVFGKDVKNTSNHSVWDKKIPAKTENHFKTAFVPELKKKPDVNESGFWD